MTYWQLQNIISHRTAEKKLNQYRRWLPTKRQKLLLFHAKKKQQRNTHCDWSVMGLPPNIIPLTNSDQLFVIRFVFFFLRNQWWLTFFNLFVSVTPFSRVATYKQWRYAFNIILIHMYSSPTTFAVTNTAITNHLVFECFIASSSPYLFTA